MHTAKKALYKFEGTSLETLPAIDSDEFTNVQKEIHERYKTSTKRNNSNVATSIKLVKGYKYGVPNKVKVAAIEDYLSSGIATAQNKYNGLDLTSN